MDPDDFVLTIAISTVNSNLKELLSYLHRIKICVPACIEFVVISQLESKSGSYNDAGIKVVLSPDKGLSKSRNLALSLCCTEWIWFQDDDIALIIDRIRFLIEALKSLDCELVLAKVSSLENPSKNFKDYGRYKVNKKLLSFRISSIEILAKTKFLKEKNIMFDEKLGLGSSLPSGEENLFFYECVVRNGARFEIYRENVCLHTTLPGNRNIHYEARYKARGYLLRKTNNILSPFMLIWWAVRNTRDGAPRISRLRLMLKEYCRSA